VYLQPQKPRGVSALPPTGQCPRRHPQPQKPRGVSALPNRSIVYASAQDVPGEAVVHEVEDLMFRNFARGQTGDRMAPSVILN
jgi:hypothetical protein